jgi:hypothetical protein
LDANPATEGSLAFVEAPQIGGDPESKPFGEGKVEDSSAFTQAGPRIGTSIASALTRPPVWRVTPGASCMCILRRVLAG